MSKFIIQPHGRLNDWVADEKSYFTEEGLDYELNVEGSRKNTPRLSAVDLPSPLEDHRFGAYERYAEGHGRKGEGAGDVSCACHWTVNQAAKVEQGSRWGNAYRVDAALARKIPAVNVWGPQLYLLEQHGFRRIVSTTFMMAFMFPRHIAAENIERYMRCLIRAQSDIDLQP